MAADRVPMICAKDSTPAAISDAFARQAAHMRPGPLGPIGQCVVYIPGQARSPDGQVGKTRSPATAIAVAAPARPVRALDRIRAAPYAIGGYACTFNQAYRRNGVLNRLAPGAVARAIAAGNIYLLRDHAEGAPSQASTDAGTLHVEEDEYGFWFEAALPEDADGALLLNRISTGDIREVSTGSVDDLFVTVDGIRVWIQLNVWEISLATPPRRAARVGTFVHRNLVARHRRSRVRAGARVTL